MVLVIGGSGSGKSAYAEQCMLSLSPGKIMYYLATMKIDGPESREKVKRHKAMRRGRGFLTIEQPVDIEQAGKRMKTGKKAVLVECMSNLAANEMFMGGPPKMKEAVEEKIVRGIEALKAEAAHMVIVSSNVFEDGAVYDTFTMEYIRAMGRINARLAAMADRVVEVVVGIPLTVKG